MPEIYSTAETFQRRVTQYIANVPNGSDDILIFGKIQEVHRQTLVIFDCPTAINLTFHNANLKLNEVML